MAYLTWPCPNVECIRRRKELRSGSVFALGKSLTCGVFPFGSGVGTILIFSLPRNCTQKRYLRTRFMLFGKELSRVYRNVEKERKPAGTAGVLIYIITSPLGFFLEGKNLNSEYIRCILIYHTIHEYNW